MHYERTDDGCHETIDAITLVQKMIAAVQTSPALSDRFRPKMKNVGADTKQMLSPMYESTIRVCSFMACANPNNLTASIAIAAVRHDIRMTAVPAFIEAVSSGVVRFVLAVIVVASAYVCILNSPVERRSNEGMLNPWCGNSM